ncbi:EF-P lysine aminoacylase EpmA [Marinobacterium lutimaris]|uniref:Lysyl-tRNA synthetase, class 2 n=1 Tax=Marinobacterium lutimaris TaxID=568106 RepID=A0A1H6BKN9_9GAMM|nr:EF-P lysine aminoacylase EpmA [Marinobacterium lutimaris]SEG61212.1 lysyl-tRNA synthetase, class 2 [Marinobacterium lutimaris]
MIAIEDWRPGASIERLRARAQLLRLVREFFYQRDVMEVDTQLLSHCAVSDPFIDSIEATYRPAPGQEGVSLYLQTSPEYAMKRLLSAGAGAIYQLGKVFRNGESGSRHNPEFTMLEWYRPGWNAQALMDEVEALVTEAIPGFAAERIGYRDLFLRELGVDTHVATVDELAALCRQHVDAPFEDDDRDTWLNLLMSEVIEPRLQAPVFVHSFPATQAALAQVVEDETGTPVATRFELFVRGIELANGYQELTDAPEQARRLELDQQKRNALGLPERPLEHRLVSALEAGMPDCAGVALGFDRLAMLALNAARIDEVIPFSFERA